MHTILFTVNMTLGIWFGFVNFFKACHKANVGVANCIIMAISWAVVITCYLHGWY